MFGELVHDVGDVRASVAEIQKHADDAPIADFVDVVSVTDCDGWHSFFSFAEVDLDLDCCWRRCIIAVSHSQFGKNLLDEVLLMQFESC